MPQRCLAGTDDPMLQAASTRSFNHQAEMMNSDLAHTGHEQNWSAHVQQNLDEHESHSLGGYGERADSGSEGPRFVRFHASIAQARHFERVQPYPPEIMPAQSEIQQGGVPATKTAGSRRALWLGSAGFTVVAAGIISAVAAVQANRPLPFETWARRDLMHRAGELHGASESPDAAIAGGGAHGSDGLGSAAPAQPVAAQPAPAADRQIGDRDAIGSQDAGSTQSEIEIAALGQVLTAAAEADELAANPPTPLLSAPTAVIEQRPEPRIDTTPGPAATPAPAVAFELEVPAGMGGPLQLVPIGAAPGGAIAPQRGRAVPARLLDSHGAFRVQLAALRDEDNVRYAWHDYVDAFGPLADGLQRYVVRANTRSGVFHLLQIGPLGDLEHANSMCSEIRQRGHDCAVVHLRS